MLDPVQPLEYETGLFRYSLIINDLLACTNRLQFNIDFSSEVAKLFANHVGGSLIFIGYNDPYGATSFPGSLCRRDPGNEVAP